ncbi:MAG: hypothetical protein U1E83_09755 [Methylotetracoccus sp.]
MERLGLVEQAAPAVSSSGLTGVERYLRLHGLASSTGEAAAPSTDAPAGPKGALTGVGRYLAMQSAAAAPAAPVAEPEETVSPAPPEAPVVAEAAPAPAPKPAAAKEAAPKRAPAPKEKKAVEAPSSEIVGQCQAATVKGTQCRHTTGLVQIERVINQKKHDFIVCMQHADDSFKPFKGLL